MFRDPIDSVEKGRSTQAAGQPKKSIPEAERSRPFHQSLCSVRSLQFHPNYSLSLLSSDGLLEWRVSVGEGAGALVLLPLLPPVVPLLLRLLLLQLLPRRGAPHFRLRLGSRALRETAYRHMRKSKQMLKKVQLQEIFFGWLLDRKIYYCVTCGTACP
ncbi:unnamed protein product [Urochloa humidicola]